MYFYDVLTNENLCKEIDDICDSNSTAYPFERKAARLNAALDSYFQLAWSVNRRRPLDDTNNTSIPLEETNIVSGTNYYKMGDFTKKFVGLIEVSILNSDATPVHLTQEFLGNLPGDFDELYGTYGAANFTGVPDRYCIIGDYIYLRPCPDYAEASGLKVYGNLASSKFTYARCTISEANPGVVTATAHGLSENDTVILRTTGDLPTNLSADTLYYLVSTVAANTFSLATERGGAAINTTGSAETGEHAFLQVNKEPGIPPLYDHYMYLARKAALPYLFEKGKDNANAIASLLEKDEMLIKDYFANKDTDIDNRITFKQRAYK